METVWSYKVNEPILKSRKLGEKDMLYQYILFYDPDPYRLKALHFF